MLAKNFKTSISAFDHIPAEQLYIFPGGASDPIFHKCIYSTWHIYAVPPTSNTVVQDPQGQVPSPFVYKLSQVNATQLDGGSVKIVDSSIFSVSTAIAVAEVTVEPGAMRELHVRFVYTFGLFGAAPDTALSGTLLRTSGPTTCKYPSLRCVPYPMY